MNESKLTAEELAEMKVKIGRFIALSAFATPEDLTKFGKDAAILFAEVELLRNSRNDEAELDAYRAQQADERAEELEAALADLAPLRHDFDTAMANVESLMRKNKRLHAELSACTESPGGCGYWREATKQREQENKRLQAEAAAMREALIGNCSEICCDAGGYGKGRLKCDEDCSAYKALSSDAGKAMLERMEKLEALFSKSQVIELKDGGGFIGILAADALAVFAALDAKEGE